MPAAITLPGWIDRGRRDVQQAFRAAGRTHRALQGRIGRVLGLYCAHYWRQAAYDAAGLAELRGDELVTAFRLATGMRGAAAPVGQRGDRPDAPRRDARQG